MFLNVLQKNEFFLVLNFINKYSFTTKMSTKINKYCGFNRCKNYKQNNKQLCYIHEKKQNHVQRLPPLDYYKIFTLLTTVLFILFVYFEEEVYELVKDIVHNIDSYSMNNRELVDYIKSTYKDIYLLSNDIYDKVNIVYVDTLKFIVEKYNNVSTYNIMNMYGYVFYYIYTKPTYVYTFISGYIIGCAFE